MAPCRGARRSRQVAGPGLQETFGDHEDDEVESMRPSHNGTPTSRAAAEQIEPVAGKARATVLDYLRSRSTEGATADEIEKDTGIAGKTVRPRISELRQMGVVEDSKTARPTRSGRRAVVWVSL
jgi:hypothetical protein